jgi:Putative DNA-binding domain
MPAIEDLEPLLSAPAEALDVEYKSWLDLRSNDEHRAALAKAAIALANEGGGYIVVGIREARPNLISDERPAEIEPYDQDLINQIVRRFAAPAFQCNLTLLRHPITGHEHAIVVVPGGFGFPVMSRSGTPGNTIRPHLCYMRKPGPESAPPENQADWDRLLSRCIRNRQVEMLDAIRTIVVGGTVVTAETAEARELEAQEAFADAARSRWQQLVADLPPDAAARCPNGRLELDYALLGNFGQPGLAALFEMLRGAEIRHSSWPEFQVPYQQVPYQQLPIPIDDTVECWLAASDLRIRQAHTSDFWRASPEGRLFMLRGFIEDSSGPWPQPVEPGTILDIRIPIYLVGECLLHAAQLASILAPGQKVRVMLRSRWYGLLGRRLGCLDPMRDFFMAGRYVSQQDNYENVKGIVEIERIVDNLPEILHPILVPLYERFGFYRLSPAEVAAEVTRMRTNRF